MIELRELDAFVWIVKLGSFSKAAEHLCLTQPTISERIARLEQTLGTQVINRDSRPAMPTLKGRELLVIAKKMLKNRENILAQFDISSPYTGVFKLGVSETIAQSWLPIFLDHLSAKHPKMLIELTVESTPLLAKKLEHYELDLAFLMGPINAENIINKTLCQYPLVFVAHSDVVYSKSQSPLEFLTEHVFITFSKESKPYIYLRHLLDEVGVVEPRVHCSSSVWTIIQLITGKTGIGVLSPILANDHIAKGELAVLPIPLTLPQMEFTASWLKGEQSNINNEMSVLAIEIAENYLSSFRS